MAVVIRSLGKLFQNPNPKAPVSRFLCSISFHASAVPSLSHLPILQFPPFPLSTVSLSFISSPSRFISPFRRRWIPFPGPLLLYPPPWKLLQLSTPLCLRGELVLRRPVSLNLFPKNLGLRTVRGLEDAIHLVNERDLGAREVEKGARSGNAVENFANLPNLISLSRMVSGPFIGWMILNEYYVSSFVGLVISGASDWLDGFVARKMGIDSVIGSYLDPLADKVLIGCVAVSMVKMDLLQSWLVGLVLFRDIALVSGAFYKRACSLGWEWKSWSEFINLDMHAEKVEPLFISKVNTVFQLALVAAALLQTDFGSDETQSYITFLGWLVASTTVASSMAYGIQHIKSGSASAPKYLGSAFKRKSH